jgi:hypothetical protein
MRGFERTTEKQELYERALRDRRYPVQIVWGADDPALKLAVHGEEARRAAGLEEIHPVPAKHSSRKTRRRRSPRPSRCSRAADRLTPPRDRSA